MAFHDQAIIGLLFIVVLGSTTLPWTSEGVPRALRERERELAEAATATATAPPTPTATAAANHKEWASKQGKVYKDPAEKDKRQKVFNSNLEFINKFNAQSKSFKLKTNSYADMTNQEFHQNQTGGFKMVNLARVQTSARMSFPADYRTQGVDSGSSVPPAVDWRTKKALNPIRNQHTCSSCWAFATVATVESASYIKTGKLPTLSEQQLVDCVVGPNSFGCRGGNPDEAFMYIKNNGGIASATSYPYIGKSGSCTGTKHPAAVKIAGYVDIPLNSEEAMKFAVSKTPVVTFIDSRGPAFQFYASGVFDATCGTTLDHLVAVVGYGTTKEGMPYWLLRNSWGTEWGEAGYMRLRRNAGPPEGQCGIAMFASYPVV